MAGAEKNINWGELGESLAQLSMDEPPPAETLERSLDCAERLAAQVPSESGERQALIEAMIACLAAARARHILYVFVVPHLVSAAQLLSERSLEKTALAGCRYELETMLPLPGSERGAPDVPITALRRGTTSDTRD